MRRFIAPLLLIVALPLTGRAQDAPSIETTVTSRRISLSDTIDLQIRASGSYDQIVEPALRDWAVTSSSTSFQTSIIGGSFTQSRVITKTIEPRKAGTLQVEATGLLAGGRLVAEAAPITVHVQAPKDVPVTTPQEAGNLKSHAGEPLFLLPNISESKLYAGQPFVLGFDLYKRSNVSVRNNGFGNVPKLEGFLSTDLVTGDKPPRSRRQVGRTVYDVFTLRRHLLVPLKAGKVTIDPLEIKLITGDVFSQRRVTVRSKPFVLDVLDVPTAGRPAGYREGQVGKFQVAAELTKADPKVGERMVLEVTVKGNGNLGAIKAPEIPRIDGLDIEPLPGGDQAEVERDTSGEHGELGFGYVLTPTRAGSLTVPPIELVYFDPRRGRFATGKSQPIVVEVAASEAVAAAGGGGPAGGIRPIVGEASLHAVGIGPDRASAVFWAALAAPLLLFFGLEVRERTRRRREANAPATRVRRAHARARKTLDRTFDKSAPAKDQAFFQAISSALLGYVEDRFGIATTGLVHAELVAALTREGLPRELIDRLVGELDNCDFARFAPASVRSGEMQGSLDRARALLDEMEAAAARGLEGAHA